MKCTLCDGDLRDFHQWKEKKFVRCENCRSILLLPDHFLNPVQEQNHYLLHNNDVTDLRYKKFVSPEINRISNDLPLTHKGLDFGCGTGPVAAFELTALGYNIDLYDPFFKNQPDNLEKSYDFIICCEVMEHFHQPYKEFNLLYRMLNPGGKIYCKTMLYYEDMNFDSWHYKNDPTHVFLYTVKSLGWIRKHFGFKKLNISPDLIVFEK